MIDWELYKEYMNKASFHQYKFSEYLSKTLLLLNPDCKTQEEISLKWSNAIYSRFFT